MGSGSPSSCTCNARICNYNKGGGIGFGNGGAVINKNMQLKALSASLTNFMGEDKATLNYLKGDMEGAFNNLRNRISEAKPIVGLTMQPFCVDVDASYAPIEKAKFTPSDSIKEGYELIKHPSPRSSNCSVIMCIIIAVILFALAVYVIYNYVNCPCRKRNEKTLQEALSLT